MIAQMSTDFLSKLNTVSLFEIWRLRAVMDKYLEDPYRLKQVRNRLRLGQNISYFSTEENRDIKGVITKIGKTRVLIKHDHDNKNWYIPFYMLNLDGIPTNIKTQNTQIDRFTLKIGEKVGFINHRENNRELYGSVIKLNPKTATVKVNTCERWRVCYENLFYVYEGLKEKK